MKKIIAAVVLVVCILLIGAFYTGFFVSEIVSDEMCETEHIWQPDEGPCNWCGNIREDYAELIHSPTTNFLVTAWQTGSGARSVPLSMKGGVVQSEPCLGGWDAVRGYYKVEINEGYGWSAILDTGPNPISNPDIVGSFTGMPGVQTLTEETQGGIIWPWLFGSAVFRDMHVVTFRLKDPHVGGLRVTQYTIFDKPWLGGQATKVTSTDHIKLVSGAGDLVLDQPQTRYVAGEDTIGFRVNTGKSGVSQGGTATSLGWTLTLYDSNDGVRRMWPVPDDSHNRYFSWPIPADVINEGTSHEWTAVLNNALFDQDEVKAFVVTREELKKCPEIKPLEWSQTSYIIGETVILDMEGIPNPLGTDKIDGFQVTLQYGKTGIDWVGQYHNYYVAASNNKAAVSFAPAKGDNYVIAEVWAFDSSPSLGGLMSEQAYAEVWVKDELPAPIADDPWAFIISVVIVICAILAALFIPVPLQYRIAILVIGIAIAVIYILLYYRISPW